MLSRTVLFSAALASAAGVGVPGRLLERRLPATEDAVVAAFYPIAFAAEQITGGTVGVRNLTPAGAEPHDLELTPGDVRAVHDASLVLYFGDGFMPGLETAVRGPEGRSVDLLAQLRRQEGNAGAAAGRSPCLARSGATTPRSCA